MSALIPPGYAEVAIKTTRSGDPDPYETVLGYHVSDAPTQSDVDDLSDAIATALKPVLSGNMTYQGITVVVGSDGDRPEFESISSKGVGSAGTGELLPQNCAILIRKVSGLAGRKNAGRVYWPCAFDGDIDILGNVGSGLISAEETAWNSLVSATDVFDRMVILHTSSAIPTDVEVMICENQIATQRRRLR